MIDFLLVRIPSSIQHYWHIVDPSAQNYTTVAVKFKFLLLLFSNQLTLVYHVATYIKH